MKPFSIRSKRQYITKNACTRLNVFLLVLLLISLLTFALSIQSLTYLEDVAEFLCKRAANTNHNKRLSAQKIEGNGELFLVSADVSYEGHLFNNEFDEGVYRLLSTREMTISNFPAKTSLQYQHSLEPTERIHFISFFKLMKRWHFCVLESLVASLQHGNTTKSLPIVEIFIWTAALDELTLNSEISEMYGLLMNQVQRIPSSSREIIIRFKEFTEENAFFGTPMGDFVSCMRRNHLDVGDQKHIGNSIANGLRLAVIYKLGGLYLDIDFITIHDITLLPEGLSKQSANGPGFFNNAAFKFRSKHPFIELAMNRYVSDYKGNKWAWQGPKLLTRVLTHHCPTAQFFNGNEERGPYVMECSQSIFRTVPKNFKVNHWGSSVAYPMLGEQVFLRQPAHKMIEKYTPLLNDPKLSALLHLSHTVTKDAEIEICQSGRDNYMKTFRGVLREKHCPNVLFTMFRNNDCDFG